MFTYLRGEGKKQGAAAPFSTGTLRPGHRLYAVGDIHGCADLLDALLGQITADAKNYAGDITLLFVGDYIDRGPDSAPVVDRLRKPFPKKWNVVFLKGNHEWALQEFLRHPTRRADWLGWGGDTTLASYGVPLFGKNHLPRPLPALAAELQNAIDERGHNAFYASLQPYWQCDGYAFVHAGVRRGVALPDQLENDLLFIRDQFIGRPHGLPQRIVFGHTIFTEPLVEADRIGIDTGAYQSGVLTALVLEENTRRFFHTQLAGAKPTA